MMTYIIIRNKMYKIPNPKRHFILWFLCLFVFVCLFVCFVGVFFGCYFSGSGGDSYDYDI